MSYLNQLHNNYVNYAERVPFLDGSLRGVAGHPCNSDAQCEGRSARNKGRKSPWKPAANKQPYIFWINALQFLMQRK